MGNPEDRDVKVKEEAYDCKVCGQAHYADRVCVRHANALRAIVGLYAEAMEGMYNAIVKDKSVQDFEDAYMSLMKGEPLGDIKAAMEMMRDKSV